MPNDRERLEALERDVAELRALVRSLTAAAEGPPHPNLYAGNIIATDPTREPADPMKWFLGESDDRGLYFFFQRRPPNQGSDYWAGWETFERPPSPAAPVAWGYGSLPGRAWVQHWLLEANGRQVSPEIVTPRITLQEPLYRNKITGVFERPASFDGGGTPLDAEGRVMGGIYYDAADSGTYLTRDGDDVVLYVQHAEVERWPSRDKAHAEGDPL